MFCFCFRAEKTDVFECCFVCYVKFKRQISIYPFCSNGDLVLERFPIERIRELFLVLIFKQSYSLYK